ncbi:hypothetical protein [Actimicrobium sp. CCI2.3]|uniref:hypothetical protein n=1 Tax=Actimicrobium sp. CCI2.3 TaxID=3048616 RepID=UPI002AB37CA1|nr:hypothetical protein [Actimicrobium sp. CCI2.3]MDY7574596.1 hypothetical protein [Actimicrobium sp. CCI2.3]MEB0020972.1 hypothetical protein [Actimicrobium sp. CCI2.3]
MINMAWQRQLTYRLNQIGMTGCAGLVMLLLAALASYTLVRAGHQETASTQRKLQSIRQQLALKSSLPLHSALNHEEQLRVFYTGFAQIDKLPDTLKRVYKAAGEQGLTLESGEYARLQTGTDRLAQFRVSLPVKGSFMQILSFMEKVLQENSNIALENIVFKRDRVSDEVLDARLVYLVYMDTQP